MVGQRNWFRVKPASKFQTATMPNKVVQQRWKCGRFAFLLHLVALLHIPSWILSHPTPEPPLSDWVEVAQEIQFDRKSCSRIFEPEVHLTTIMGKACCNCNYSCSHTSTTFCK